MSNKANSKEPKPAPVIENEKLEPFNRVMDKALKTTNTYFENHLVFIYQLRKFMTNESDKIENELLTICTYLSGGLFIISLALFYGEIGTILSPFSFAITFLVFALFKSKQLIRRNKDDSSKS